MDTWKGEKLYGADRRLTRAQLEESSRVATTAESLDATISCMGGNKTWPSTLGALRVALDILEGFDGITEDKATLLRQRLSRGGRIVKCKRLLKADNPFSLQAALDWIQAYMEQTKKPGRRARIALLSTMELPADRARIVGLILRELMWQMKMIPYDFRTREGYEEYLAANSRNGNRLAA